VLAWLDREPSDAASLEPLLEAFDRHRERFDDTSLIELRTDDRPLLRELIARGFGIDSVIQLGDAGPALAALEGDRAAPVGEALGAHNLRLEPLERARVDAVVELHRAVFSAEPAWCWFGAYPRHLARIRADLERDRDGQFALIDASGRVVGHLGAELDDNPYFGRTGGLELILASHLRGLGLARPLYRAALSSLVERGAERIKGGTSQPGVLALGRVMRRPWHAFNLRREVAFGPEHFLRFAPDAIRARHAVDGASLTPRGTSSPA
jgi:predicted N-acetyltransferase YhbS